jgi:hypothetical protein
MIIPNDILEKTCKDMIETILFCLSYATKGTIYRVGPMPRLLAVRVTSGVREESSDQIHWGLPEASDYNYPGKNWEQYRDNPGHVMEAMGWCVERQKSWTADNPHEDLRSVRKQLSGEIEDFHHMEPVLVRKSYLYRDQRQLEYPLDYRGKPIWEDCEYVVVAVVKIHFKPFAIRRGDHSTKIIKKLSRTLGTELLSLNIRETLSEAQKELARQRLQSCNVLAHELRNTLIKLGFIFSAINAEMSYLREQWEDQVGKAFPELDSKKEIIARLNQLIEDRLPMANGTGMLGEIGRQLLASQQELAELSLMPHIGDKWVANKIIPKWNYLISEGGRAWADDKEEIERLLERLGRAMWIGMDETLASRMKHLPEDLRTKWPKLAYVDFTVDKLVVLEEVVALLNHPALDIPHKQQTKKIITSLKALVEMIPEVEERANRIIYSLKNGGVDSI